MMEAGYHDEFQMRVEECLFKAAMAYAKPVSVKAVLPGDKKFVKKFQLPEPATLASLTACIVNEVPFLAGEDIMISFLDSEGDNVIIANDDDLRNAVNEYKEAMKQPFFRISVEIPRKTKLPSGVKVVDRAGSGTSSSDPMKKKIMPKVVAPTDQQAHLQRMAYKNLERMSNPEALEMRSNVRPQHCDPMAKHGLMPSTAEMGPARKKITRRSTRRPRKDEEGFAEIFNDADSDAIMSDEEMTENVHRVNDFDCGVNNTSFENPYNNRCESSISFEPIASSMHGNSQGWSVAGKEDGSHPHSFISQGGLKKDLRGKSILDIFFCVFTMDLLDYIIRETNRYHSQHSPESDETWEDLTRNELLMFLTLLTLTGHHTMDRLGDLWTEKYFMEYPFFRSCMPRKRFFTILSYLHFCDNNTPPDPSSPWYDRAWKIRPVLNMLLAQYQALYDPQEHLLVDRIMIKHRGKVIFNQHVPKKSNQSILKLWKLCDSRSYTYDLLLYTEQDRVWDPENVVMPHKLIADLTKPLRGKGHTILTDSYFTSPALFRELYATGFNAVGAVKASRVGMPEMMNTNMKQGEVRYRRNYNLLAVTWRDNRKDFNLLSTFHKGQKDGLYQTAKDKSDVPPSLLYYNKYMGYVERTNKNVASHTYIRRSWKWTKKLFFHLLDLSIVNCYVLYCHADGAVQTITHRNFRLALLDQLFAMLYSNTAPPAAPPQKRKRSSSDRLDAQNCRHWPNLNEKRRDKPNQRQSVNCVVCKSKNLRKKSVIHCKSCRVVLCPHPCFEVYHTQLVYAVSDSES